MHAMHSRRSTSFRAALLTTLTKVVLVLLQAWLALALFHSTLGVFERESVTDIAAAGSIVAGSFRTRRLPSSSGSVPCV